ncbi:MAG TPA: carbonic anhydrase [Azospirillaceae bacterium]|nr:carbonic anhydrase [Azospirillaceae bacterium]
MDELLDGFQRFRTSQLPDLQGRFQQLARLGQAPKAVVVSCCDSRVDPQLIFQAGPGDLFVIRNVANLVPPYHPNADYHGTSAALEFGIRNLGTPRIVVLGHTLCGGIRALLEDDQDGDFIGTWMAIAQPVRDRVCGCGGCHEVTEDMNRAAEVEGIRVSLDNLITFPWIKERVEAGTLTLHGWLFDVASGDLRMVDERRAIGAA